MNLTTIARQWFKTEGDKLPVVCIFGRKNVALNTPKGADYEEERLDCRCYPSDSKLEEVLVRDRPHVLITVGQRDTFPNLAKAPFAIRKRWLHYDTLPDPDQLALSAYDHYLGNLFDDGKSDEQPLVTVFTAAYDTSEHISRPFKSLREQTYTNWQWVIVDDSDDHGQTFRVLKRIAKEDHRVEIFTSREHSGVIGRVKNWACSLAGGQILVELDHDDELTDRALEWVVNGFRQFPEAGFLYTDSAEVYANGGNLTYRDGWAFGFGSYRDVEYRGKLYKSGCAGNINSKTIRHIISCPNHIRAWRRSCYESIGGHNKALHAADDYELIVRTFLATRMARIPRLCYIQHHGCTAQQARSGDIHRHVRSIRAHYDPMIHERLLALGCEDFAWDETRGCFDDRLPNPEVESHATLTVAVQDFPDKLSGCDLPCLPAGFASFPVSAT